MKNICKIFFLFLLTFIQIKSDTAIAQNKKTDSLLSTLQTTKEDTTKVNVFNTLFLQYEFADGKKAKEYLNKALELSKKINYNKGIANSYTYAGYFAEDKGDFNEALKNYMASLKVIKVIGDIKGEANSYNNLGNVYINQGNYSEALKNYFASLKIRKTIADKKGEASNYNNIGMVYFYQGNYPEALKNHLASLKSREEIGDKQGRANSYNNIGLVYYTQNNYSEALKNYFVSLKISESITDKTGIAGTLSNIGLVYYHQRNYPDALKNYFACLKIEDTLGNKAGIATSYKNIGNVYDSQGNYQDALKYQFLCLKIEDAIGNKAGAAGSYCNIGNEYTNQKKYQEAEQYYLKSKQLSKEIGHKEFLKDSYSGLSQLDSIRGNYKAAYENYKTFILYRDSLDNDETRKKIIQSQMTYDFERKELETKAEQEKKDSMAQANLIQEKFAKYLITGIALIILLASVILVVLNNGKHKIRQLEQRNELRKNMADDLHDEIGAGLTKITMICENGKAGLKKQNPVDIFLLDSISAQSRTISENLSEVIWAAHPQNDTLLSLVSTIRSYSSKFLEDSSIQYTIHFPDEIKSIKTNPNINRNLYLIVKETLNNCVKHSKADLVNIHFSLEKNKNYILKIKDNGIGFNTSAMPENRNGLKSLKSRALAINAALNVTSVINEGTVIELSGSI